MLNWLMCNWLNLGLVLVGFSAYGVYFYQKRCEKKSAATLLVGQILLVEKRVAALKNHDILSPANMYNSKSILVDNEWDKCKHLFIKNLSRVEYDMVQNFYENAEEIERARAGIVGTILTAWADKSHGVHTHAMNCVADKLREGKDVETKELPNLIRKEVSEFQKLYNPLDVPFVPDIVNISLKKNLTTFAVLSGTSAFDKIQRKSYQK